MFGKGCAVERWECGFRRAVDDFGAFDTVSDHRSLRSTVRLPRHDLLNTNGLVN